MLTNKQTRRSTVWRDITTDHKTGHTVFKDWSKAISFLAGLVYLFLLVPTVLLLTAWLRPEKEPIVLPVDVGVALLGTGLTTQLIKEYFGQRNRKTQDEDGALATAEGNPVPPPLMPQGPPVTPTSQQPGQGICG
jgi:hypothetical protein